MLQFPFQLGGIGLFQYRKLSRDLGDLYFNNVSLLLHMNGGDNSTSFIDSSLTARTFTTYGNAKISAAQGMFGSTSGVFDGNGGYISTPATTNLDLTSGDFTIEGWIYPTSSPTNSQQILNKDGVFGTSSSQYVIEYISGGKINAGLGNGNGTNPTITTYTGTSTIALNTWHHFALVKSGTSVNLYVNGVSEASGTAPTMYEGNKPLLIGYQTGQPSSTYFNGYIDDIRITKGVARYTANFTPPTLPFPDCASDLYYSFVPLLLNMNGDNSSNIFTDSSPKGRSPTITGTPTISTTQSKFGGASGDFTAGTGYLDYGTSTDWAFGTGDFTVECWVYITAMPSGYYYSPIGNWVSNTGWCLFIRPSGTLDWHGDTTVFTSASGALTTNTWYHIAYSRQGSTGRLFIDGTQVATGTDTTNLSLDIALRVGSNGTSTDTYKGYIDDVRITKGIARYTGAFTKPEGPLADIGTQYRYWRLNVTANNGDAYLAASEFEVHATLGGTTIFTGGSSSASTVFGGLPVSNLFDGSTSTVWAATTNTGWVRYDLGLGKTSGVMEFVVKSRGDGYATQAPKDFSLQGSNDGVNWDTLKTITNQTGWGLGETRTFQI